MKTTRNIASTLFTAFAALGFISCTGNGSLSSMMGNPEIVKIDMDAEEKVVNLSELTDSIVFVPLETNETSQFGNMDKLIIDKERFIIVDKDVSSAVYVFDSEGHFYNKIGSKGKAGNEYVNLTDATVGNGNVYIYDAYSKKIVCYAMDGTYKETYPFEYIATDFRYIGGNTFAFYCSYSPNMELAEGDQVPNFILYDIESKSLQKDMMFDATCSYDALPISSNNLNPYLYDALSREIYGINEKDKYLVAQIDYEEPYNKMQDEFLKRAYSGLANMKDLDEAKAEGTLPELRNFMNTGNAFFVFCTKGSKSFYNFYFYNTGKTVHAVGNKVPIKDDLYASIKMIPKAAGNGNLYVKVEPSYVSGEKFPVKVQPNDNPVIAIIKLKE